MRTRILASAALAAGLTTLAAPAAAQDRLTLETAVREALAQHPALLAAAARVDEARAHAEAARAAWFPEVWLTDAWQRSNQPVFAFSALLSARAFTSADFAVDRLNHPDTRSAMTGRVLVRQKLFDGTTGAGVAAGTARYDIARATLDEQRADIALDVTRAYGHLLVARSADAAAAAAASAAREDVGRAERRRETGLATDADVLAFSVHAAAMARRQIAAGGDVIVARAALNRLMGRPIDGPVSVSEPALPGGAAGDPVALLHEAVERRPEVQRREAERRAADAGHRLARAAWLPRVSAQAGYQADGLEFFDRAGSWAVGGDVAWSLSLGGAERARARAAQAAIAAADALAADTRAALHLDMVTAATALETARARVTAGARALAEATERERITRNRYEAGLAGTTDVLTAVAATLDTEAERVAALVDAIVARADLNRALGRPPEDNP